MKRLVYAPKVYIFIRSRTNGITYDVSDYVVSGNVQRNIDAPSTAEFVLKNRFFEFSANQKGKPRFLPQDGVTIWLQRIAGRPIQVFTGYLDRVPYYQLYPGNGPFKATCTLKRLNTTFFDPGLPATTQFFIRNNWSLNPVDQTVTAFDGNMIGQTLGNVNNTSTDSGLGVLLYKFMQEIAGWNTSALSVSSLPADLPAQVSKIYSRINAGTEIEQQAYEKFLAQLMSLKVQHSPGELAALGPPQLSAIKDLKKEGDRTGVSVDLLTVSALMFSGLYPMYKNTDNRSVASGYGLFAAPSDTQGISAGGETVAGQNGSFDGGHTMTQIFTPRIAAQAYIKRLKQAASTGDPRTVNVSQDILRNPGAHSNRVIAALISKATGKDAALIQAALDQNWDTAKQYNATMIDGKPTPTGVTTAPVLLWQANTSTLSNNVTWGTVRDVLSEAKYTDGERTTIDSGHYTNLLKNYNRAAAFAWVGLTAYDMRISDYRSFDHRGDWLVLTPGPNAQVGGGSWQEFANWAHSQVTTKGRVEVFSQQEDPTAPNGLRNRSSVNGRFQTPAGAVPVTGIGSSASNLNVKQNFVAIHMTDNTQTIDPPVWNGTPLFSNTNNQVDPVRTDFTFQDLQKIDFASAFATKFQFPSNAVESMYLSGDKSLMNDIPVMEGVRQIANASMRSFMSLPNGDFMAFYPDYFGAYGRKAYWSISDLEIVDLGINLTDDALATHVFVTGGTIVPNEINFQNTIMSRGVVTMEDMFSSTENFISGDLSFFTGNKKNPDQGMGNIANIAEFLRVYGARPKKIDNPIIRSHWFEFLYALQMFMYMWSMQFATKCEFTFQPELMAGGRVALSDHGLECYIENVQHNWDYSGGFTTTATLTAPTVADKNQKSWPGMALATGLSGFANVNTGMGGG